MAKRHEDRKPGQRFSRGTDSQRGNNPRGGGRSQGPARGQRGDRDEGPSRGGPRPFGKRPVRGGGARKSGIKVTARPAREVDDGKVRLNRFLAMSGVCSRRAADELIESGSVEVNGVTVTELGFRVDPLRQGMNAFRAGRHEDCLKALAELKDDPRAAYWRGRAFERLDKVAEAIAAYEECARHPAAGDYKQRAQDDLEFLRWRRDFGVRMQPRVVEGSKP